MDDAALIYEAVARLYEESPTVDELDEAIACIQHAITAGVDDSMALLDRTVGQLLADADPEFTAMADRELGADYCRRALAAYHAGKED